MTIEGGSRRWARLTTVGLLTLAALCATSLQHAMADRSDPNCYDKTPGGRIIYICGDNQPGEDGQDGDDGEGSGGTGGQPQCDLSLVKQYSETWCEGENACWANIPSAVYPTPDTWPEEPPTEDSVYIFKECLGPDGTIVYSDWSWHVPDQPSVEELARQAFGELAAPDFSLAFSPPEQSIIFVDTWWWADGPGEGEIIGSSALGVVAVGTPSHMDVDPGDGSGTMTCPFVTTESDDCSHTYNRASNDPGYTAQARLVYDVHFEQNGNPLDLPGLPDTLEGPWVEAVVPVVESQAVVVH
ncbi:hypothetical protein [Streptomyces litchfieldiae]|uniref:Uncharacterized protein n=1 Tax=Streptomyces litchfieldiae TaxID=3075543 RepID=A0ABU2MLJ3_9ACTN|nr:hypothetical protein [Streptomyces sp. DSM 44938]MDT0341798.1 hypothetical protein [Streptomyces sp. DSM 44938]